MCIWKFPKILVIDILRIIQYQASAVTEKASAYSLIGATAACSLWRGRNYTCKYIDILTVTMEFKTTKYQFILWNQIFWSLLVDLSGNPIVDEMIENVYNCSRMVDKSCWLAKSYLEVILLWRDAQKVKVMSDLQEWSCNKESWFLLVLHVPDEDNWKGSFDFFYVQHLTAIYLRVRYVGQGLDKLSLAELFNPSS